MSPRLGLRPRLTPLPSAISLIAPTINLALPKTLFYK